jgi:elongation factor P
MYSASDLKKGLKILWEGVPYAVTEFQFVKPGKGAAMYKCRLRNMLQGNTLEKTFREVDRFEVPNLEDRELQYSYIDGDQYVFSDPKTYEEYHIHEDVLGDNKHFLNENMIVDILFFNDKPVEVTLPSFVEKEIVDTEPGFKGNTATNTYKAAKIPGGYEIQVPLFINQGDIVRIDTRTGQYADRVSSARR